MKGSWVINAEHWDGLPGHTQPHAGPTTSSVDHASSAAGDEPARAWTQVEVAHRPLADYDLICHEHHAEIITINGPSYRLKDRTLTTEKGDRR